MFLLLSAIVALSNSSLKPPVKSLIPSRILNQFLDYDLVIHFDNSNLHRLDFLSEKNPNHQTVHLFNYNYIQTVLRRPRGYKYVNVVILQDPFEFQTFSLQPYSFYQYDFVLFVTTTIQETEVWKMAGLKRASAVFVYNIEEDKMFHCCYYCGKDTAVLKETTSYSLRQLLNNYSDFNGHIFRIAYTDFPPFFWKNDDGGRPRGAEGKLLHEFSRVHNFRWVSYYDSQNSDWFVGTN